MVNDRVMSTELPDGGTVLLDLDTELYFGLNAVGTMIWSGLRDGNPIDTIVTEVAQKFEVPIATVQVDAAELLEQLVSKGLVASNSDAD